VASSYTVDFMERETGIEPATFSLGKWLQIENKEHSEFGHLFQAIEFTGNSQVFETRLLMVFKWSSLDHWQNTRLSVAVVPHQFVVLEVQFALNRNSERRWIIEIPVSSAMNEDAGN